MAKRNIHVVITQSSNNRLRNYGSRKSYPPVQHFQLFENQIIVYPKNRTKSESIILVYILWEISYVLFIKLIGSL